MAEMTERFRRSFDALPEIFALVRTFAARERLESEVQFSIDFAVEEIFTNMVKYNGEGRSDVEIALEVRDGELVITLTDFDTDPFDINIDAPEVDIAKPLSERTPGGLGLHLMKKMMDRVEYSHENRIGTIILYKHLK